jgi:hypothetical protein
MTKVGVLGPRIPHEVGPRVRNKTLRVGKVHLQSLHHSVQHWIVVVVAGRKVSSIRHNVNGIVVLGIRGPFSIPPAAVHNPQLHGPTAMRIIGTIKVRCVGATVILLWNEQDVCGMDIRNCIVRAMSGRQHKRSSDRAIVLDYSSRARVGCVTERVKNASGSFVHGTASCPVGVRHGRLKGALSQQLAVTGHWVVEDKVTRNRGRDSFGCPKIKDLLGTGIGLGTGLRMVEDRLGKREQRSRELVQRLLTVNRSTRFGMAKRWMFVLTRPFATPRMVVITVKIGSIIIMVVAVSVDKIKKRRIL